MFALMWVKCRCVFEMPLIALSVSMTFKMFEMFEMFEMTKCTSLISMTMWAITIKPTSIYRYRAFGGN